MSTAVLLVIRHEFEVLVFSENAPQVQPFVGMRNVVDCEFDWMVRLSNTDEIMSGKCLFHADLQG